MRFPPWPVALSLVRAAGILDDLMPEIYLAQEPVFA
jgi:hypothetical protein